MRTRAAWVVILLVVIAGEVRADAVQRFVDSLQLPQSGYCGFDPEIHVMQRWPDRSTKVFVATYAKDNECWTALGIFRAHRNGRFQRLAEWQGMPRRIELLDVTGNGVPEILATGHPGNRSAPVFILKWDGAKLKQIGETSDRSAYVDLDHDGVLEIVEGATYDFNECGGRVGRSFVQRLRNGKYVSIPNAALVSVDVWSKETAERELLTSTLFLPDDASGRARIRIVNGTRGGRNRAGKVELRARRFVSDEQQEPYPGQLLPVHATGADEYTQGEVELPSRCVMLDVILDGPPEATVTIVIEMI